MPEVVVVVELDLDEVTSSTAAEDGDGVRCYATPKTSAAFAPLTIGARTRKYQSITARPMGGLQAVPCLVSCDLSEDSIRIGEGRSEYGRATVRLYDWQDDDRLEDPYWDDRDPKIGLGSYWRRLLARHRTLVGRIMRVRWGPWARTYADSDYQTRTFVIQELTGPDEDGMVEIVGASPLAILLQGKVEVPPASTGLLAAAIDALATSATVDDATSYGSSGTVRIGDECCTYTRSGNTLTLTRAQHGTEADDHDAGETVQECAVYDSDSVDEVILSILTAAGVDSGYWTAADWQDEREKWFSGYSLSAVVAEPTPAVDFIDEICRALRVSVFWDAASAKLILRGTHPAIGSVDYLSDSGIINRAQIERDASARVSRTSICIGIRSAVDDIEDQLSYLTRYDGAEAGVGDGEWPTGKQELIFCRWLPAGQLAIAAAVSRSVTEHLVDGRSMIRCRVPVATGDALTVGDPLDISTADWADSEGEPLEQRCILVGKTAVGPGLAWELALEVSAYTASRYAVFMVDGSDTYENTDEEDRVVAGFFCGDDELMPDGSTPYRFN